MLVCRGRYVHFNLVFVPFNASGLREILNILSLDPELDLNEN